MSVGVVRPRILLVEDHDESRRVTARLLRREGYAVVEADGYGAAVDVGKPGTFELLLTDIELNDGSGIDLARRLGAGGAVPAIALTGIGWPGDGRVHPTGFCAHFLKPINFARLLAKIEECARQTTAVTGDRTVV